MKSSPLQRSFLLFAILVASPVAAQDSVRTDGTSPVSRDAVRPICVSARPRPACSRYIISEVGFLGAVASTSTNIFEGGNVVPDIRKDISHRFAFTFGLASNGRSTATGAAVNLDVGEAGFGGFELRHRRWFGVRPAGIDLSAGYARAMIPGKLDCREATSADIGFAPGDTACFKAKEDEILGHGFKVGVALAPNPYVGLIARVEAVHTAQGWHKATLVGAHGSAQMSLAASVVVLGIVLLAVATSIGSM